MRHHCPVCGYPGLHDPPHTKQGGSSYEICPSCGFQFGVDDEDRGISFADWRARWIENGMRWQGASGPPAGWNPEQQLRTVQREKH